MLNWRSALYVPGDRPAMLAKAHLRGADALILNLEDAVGIANRDLAREQIVTLLRKREPGWPALAVRINVLDSDAGYEDLLAVIPAAPNCIVIPKVDSATQIHIAAWVLDRLEARSGLTMGSTGLIAMPESAAGIEAAFQIAAANPRMRALLLGAADLATELGCTPALTHPAIQYAATRLISAARAASVAALAPTYMRIGDDDGLRQATELAVSFGFDGQSAIHPGQVALINRLIGPDQAELQWAQQVIDLLGDTSAKGAALLHGELIEAPHVKRAQRILARVRDTVTPPKDAQ